MNGNQKKRTMSKVHFISDLHLGHKSIVKFASEHRNNVKTIDEHDDWIVSQWNSVVAKQDLVWILGDVCFDKEKLRLLKEMKGTKHLILGNHDEFKLDVYSEYFNKIHGFVKYKSVWLSHAPINPNQLRGKFNLHGHVHHNSLPDLRFINVSVEALNGVPVSWETLNTIMFYRKFKVT
jgi:calcineurin-like phosphoesterase family protein